jgi:hypothetical protein
MRIPSESDYLFKSPGAKRFVSRVNRDIENAILPLTYRDDPDNRFDQDRFLYARDSAALSLTEALARRPQMNSHEMLEPMVLLDQQRCQEISTLC